MADGETRWHIWRDSRTVEQRAADHREQHLFWYSCPHHRDYRRRKREERRLRLIEAGLCVVCAANPPESPSKMCRPCLDRASARERAKRRGDLKPREYRRWD